jgi:hypothetical protein
MSNNHSLDNAKSAIASHMVNMSHVLMIKIKSHIANLLKKQKDTLQR